MGEKKSKALALELIDDLLNENSPDKGEDNNRSEKGTVPVESESTVNISASAPDDKTELSDPDPPAQLEGDHTLPINTSEPDPAHSTALMPGSRDKDKVRASVGRFGPYRTPGAPSASEAALAQSESLRIAQNRILELEQELERLRLQNEELGAAGETLRRRTDELLAKNQQRENEYQNSLSRFEQEKEILLASKEALQRDLETLRRRNEELELRISTNIQKIRVRERELENRLELVKMENAAIIRSKDEMILDLKRQLDQLNIELNNYRAKNQELNRQTTDKQEMLRRTVKALRLALSMLEGEEEIPQTVQRKAK
ncbi:MAG: hypothetical protein AB7G93_08155 [Bdellovibrionales bacterium]